MVQQAVVSESELRKAAARTGVRKDIQALRAIAVVLVVVNHLWPKSVPGGYVGVDVFFVISGFLISKHLLGELERSGRLKLGSFYARRIKRLLPAAMLVAVFSMVAAWIFLPFSRWAGVAQETIASILYVENWFLAAKSVDYSAQTDAASTVQHYWSLSVEEQFYLFWPLLLLGLFALAVKLGVRRRVLLRVGIAVVSIIALVFCVWFTASNRSQAYFVTPARVWEFGAGALIALGSSGWKRNLSTSGRLVLAGVGQWAGYGMIVFAALTFNDQTFFPGTGALIPVVGTLLVVFFGPEAPVWSPGRLLELRPVQFLGDISYSLYLWHWPLIILAPSILGRGLGNLDKLLIFAVAIVLSYLSKKYIEDPGRTKLFRNAKPRVTFFAMLASMLVVCLVAGSMLISFGQTQKAEAEKLAALSEQPCYGASSLNPSNACADKFGPPTALNVGSNEAPWFDAPECKPDADPIVVQNQKLLVACDFTGGKPASATVWLIGDSHAEQWKAGIYELARKNSWKLKESLLGGCPVVDVKRVAFMDAPSTDSGTQARCLDWSKKVTSRIDGEKPNFIFTSAFGAKETIDDGTGRPQARQYKDAVNARFKQWRNAGSEIFVLRDTPLTLQRSTPDCLAANSSTLR